MSTELKALETRYAGCRFRSRLEARWAVFFDALNVEWEYEKEGFDLGGCCYLPDFWLPGVCDGAWAEIKHRDARDIQAHKSKAYQLSIASEQFVFVFYGMPGLENPDVFAGEQELGMRTALRRQTWSWHVCTGCERADVVPEAFFLKGGQWGLWPYCRSCRSPLWNEGKKLLDARVKASSARFEFGEEG